MFNTTSIRTGSTHVSNEITFNSVAGTLVKSTPDSKMVMLKMGSDQFTKMFDPSNPTRTYTKHIAGTGQWKIGGGYDNGYDTTVTVNVSVLQVMLCGNDIVLVEYIDVEEVK